MLKVDQIRYGFATNSSSSHSLAVWKGTPSEIQPDNEYFFGWDWFRLTTPFWKRRYLAAQVYSRINDFLQDERSARVLAQDYTGVELPVDRDEMVGIDHDSVWVLPSQWENGLPDREFITALGAYLDRNDVVILGGNDNEDDPGIGGGSPSLIRFPTEQGSTVARYDAKGGHWTLFDRMEGTKVRFRFDSNKPAATLSDLPELVDIKITDYCPFGCGFCYQGSTPKGQHAETRYLEDLAWKLGQEHIFEVALGGGEPTYHPDFMGIVKSFRTNGVIPNFTTRNLDEKWWAQSCAAGLMERVGGVAFSVNTQEEVKKVAALRDSKTLCFDHRARDHMSLQYIVGQDETEEALKGILKEAKKNYLRITLLGYKFTGRGAEFGQRSHPKWPEIVAEFKDYPRIGIDTVLADAGGKRLKELGLDSRCLAPTDGTFSCYIDAVKKTLHRSSYEGDSGVPLENSYGFRSAWEKVRREN